MHVPQCILNNIQCDIKTTARRLSNLSMLDDDDASSDTSSVLYNSLHDWLGNGFGVGWRVGIRNENDVSGMGDVNDDQVDVDANGSKIHPILLVFRNASQ
jgi:hypothetical protein